MKRLILIITALAVLCTAGVASAYVSPHGRAKLQILCGGTCSKAQQRYEQNCIGLALASSDRNWGLWWSPNVRHSCEVSRFAGNGGVFIHKRHGHWRNVYENSEFPCHVPGVPLSISHDLFRALPNSWGPPGTQNCFK